MESKEMYVVGFSLKSNLNQEDAARAVNAFTRVIQEALKKGETVSLVGFGSFKVSQRNARNGRNPKTGAQIKIPARNAPSFKPGKVLKQALN